MSIIQENTWYNILFWYLYEQDVAWLYFVCQAHLAITCRSLAMAVVYSLSKQLNASGSFVFFFTRELLIVVRFMMIVFQGASPSIEESLQLAVSCEQWCRARLVDRSVLLGE
jgi:hypothetical protein